MMNAQKNKEMKIYYLAHMYRTKGFKPYLP